MNTLLGPGGVSGCFISRSGTGRCTTRCRKKNDESAGSMFGRGSRISLTYRFRSRSRSRIRNPRYPKVDGAMEKEVETCLTQTGGASTITRCRGGGEEKVMTTGKRLMWNGGL